VALLAGKRQVRCQRRGDVDEEPVGEVTSGTQGHQDASDFDLRHFLHVLRRRRGTIAAAVVAVVTVVLVVTFLQTPTYQATAEVVFQPNHSAQVFGGGTIPSADPAREVQTQIEVLQSPPVRDLVAKALSLTVAPAIKATAVTGTNALKIEASSTIPRTAADIANAYAHAYTTFTQAQAVDYLNSVGKQLQTQIADLQAKIDALDQRVATAPAAERATLQTSLSQQRQSLLAQSANLQETLNSVQAQSVAPSNAAQLVTPAKVPASPSSPKPVRSGALGLVIGLLFGVALALVRDYLNDSIMSKDDLERSARGLPVIGMVPAVAGWKPSDGPVLISASAPASPTAEAYRTVRASLQFISAERDLTVIQVTSPSAGEGKTTTVANLGAALAKAGQRVCVCCSDLRRPRLHEFFDLTSDYGMTSVLSGDVPLSAAIQRAPNVPHLWVLPAGPVVENPSEVLSSSRAADLIRALRLQFDVVLIDSAPVLPVADAVVLSRLVDATLVVAAVGRTTRRGLSRTIELLRGVDAPLLGTILNGVVSEGTYGYGDGYYLYYETRAPNGKGPEPETNGRRGRRSNVGAIVD
jgi:succinoglycan biosynthesis transport protein ExoP